MIKKLFSSPVLVFIVIAGNLFLNGCKNDKTPELSTIAVISIDQSSAQTGGIIISDGGSAITSKGVCWSTQPNPTIAENKTTDGEGTAKFTSIITNLIHHTTYYIRAYATNSSGTAYGNSVSYVAGSIKDIDGNIYHTVTIGTQVWLVENLKTTRFNNDSAILNVKGYEHWNIIESAAFCWLSNDSATFKNDCGGLYNWYAVATGKLCPQGWHVSTDADWNTLETFLGGSDIAGSKLRDAGTAHWGEPNEDATNESGFTAFPGSYRDPYGDWAYDGGGYWWTSTPTGSDSSSAWGRAMNYWYTAVIRDQFDIKSGLSVRCIKD